MVDEVVVVRFVKACSPYNANETAGFQAHHARRIVVQSKGGAVYVKPPEGYDKHGKRLGADKEPGNGLRHYGGGWFELLGFTGKDGKPVTVLGRAAAEAQLEELIAKGLEAQVPAGEGDNPDNDDGSE